MHLGESALHDLTTVPAMVDSYVEECRQCAREWNHGLCPRCAERDRSIMPLLAESVLKWWMGVALVEQRRLQLAEARAVLKAKRRNARREERRRLNELCA